MRSSIFVIGALAGVAVADNNFRRLSVNDQAANLIPTVTAAPDPVELKKRQATSIGADEASVLSVLITALPSSYLEIAATNPSALATILSSEFSAGTTPSWYAALPSGVKSYFDNNGGILGSSTLAALPSLTTPSFSDLYNSALSSILAEQSTLPNYSDYYNSALSSILAEQSTLPNYSDYFNSALSSLYALTTGAYVPAQTTVRVGTATGTASPTTALSSTQKQSSGLSTGAKIGIGAGVPIAVFGVAAIAAFFLISSHRRKKKARAAAAAVGTYESKPPAQWAGTPAQVQPPPPPQYGGPQELYGGQPQFGVPPAQLAGTPVQYAPQQEPLMGQYQQAQQQPGYVQQPPAQQGGYYPPTGLAAELPPQSLVPERQPGQGPMYEMRG